MGFLETLGGVLLSILGVFLAFCMVLGVAVVILAVRRIREKLKREKQRERFGGGNDER